MLRVKLHPNSVQVTELVSGCDINGRRIQYIANYHATKNVEHRTKLRDKKIKKLSIVNEGVTIIKKRNRKCILSRQPKLNNQ